MMSEVLKTYASAVADLSDLPSITSCYFQQSGNSSSSCFYSHSALAGATLLCILIIIYSLVWSIVGNNCSKVDQIWSITPWVFGWVFFAHDYHKHNNSANARLLTVCLCMTAWGVRLTYNFARRGGYGNFFTHEEDYRWPILKKFIGNWFLFFLFNVSFIASYQNILLLLIAAPAHAITLDGDRHLNTADYALTVLFAALLVLETVADQQHFEYHLKKYAPGLTDEQRKRHPDPDVVDGFFQSGLWTYSRHPNYFFEQSIWVCVYLFSVSHKASASQLVNAYAIGPILLILLFQGSIAFGESITSTKYPRYADYQKRVSQCIPFFASSPKAAKEN